MLNSIITWPQHYLKSYFWCGNINSLPSYTQRYNRRHYATLLNMSTTSGLSIYCMALYHAQTRRHVIKHIII